MARRLVLLAGLLGLLLLGARWRTGSALEGLDPTVVTAEDDSLAGELPHLPAAKPSAATAGLRSPVLAAPHLPDEAGIEREPITPPGLRDLFVRLLAKRPAPEIDLPYWISVELWDFEPKHVLVPTRDLRRDPDSIGYGEETDRGVLFEEVPHDHTLWVSAECWFDDGARLGCAPVVAPVPPPPTRPGEAWRIELPLQLAAGVRGRVVDLDPEVDWVLRYEGTSEELESSGEEGFLFWPVGGKSVTLSLTVTEEGRAVRRLHRFPTPSTGIVDVGGLTLHGPGVEVRGRVLIDGEPATDAWLELQFDPENAVVVDVDGEAEFTLQGDLDGLKSLRACPHDIYGYEPVTLDLAGTYPDFVELVIPRRPARLCKVVVNTELEDGERVDGELYLRLENGSRSIAKLGPNHRGWCGGGIFTMPMIPPGDARYVAWIPEKGLSGTGPLHLAAAPTDKYVPRRYWNGHTVVQAVLRESKTVVSGELVGLPGTDPSRWPGYVEAIVTLCGDHQPEIEVAELEPGPFVLEGLPSDCDIHLVFRASSSDFRFETDLHLERNERLELGRVTLGAR